MDSLHETSKKNLINSIEIITPSSTHNLSSGGIIGQLILIFKGSAKTHLGSIEKEFYLFKSSFLSQGLAFRTPAYFVLPGEQGVSLSSKVADALIEIDCMSDYLTLERRMVRPRSDRVVQARQKVGSQTLKIRSFAV